MKKSYVSLPQFQNRNLSYNPSTRFMIKHTHILLTMLLLALLLGFSGIGKGQNLSINDDSRIVKKVPREQVATLQSDKIPEQVQPVAKAILNNDNIENSQPTETPSDAPLATRTASVSGNWNNTATWGGSSVPVAGDAVTINPNITVTVTAAAACASISFAAVTTSSALTISGTNTLTVSGAISMPRPSTSQTCTININGGTMTIGTTLTMSATVTARNDVINVTTGTLTVSGNTTCGTTGCIFNISSTGTMNFGGTFSSTPTLTTVTGSTVNYTSASAQTILAKTYAGNLGLSGAGTKTIATSTTVTVNGNITNSSTLVLTAGTSTTTTYLVMGGNITNTGTINSTASYTQFYFAGTTAQTFTNNGTVTSPVTSMVLQNAAGLTLSGSNQVVVTRINLFYGTLSNSNKITLGIGGTSYAVVQRGLSSNTSPAGSFDVAPTFNIGSGGYNLLYDNGSVAYSTGNEVPGSLTTGIFYIFDAADVSLSTDLTISDELNFYGGTGTPILRIGAHTLTLEGGITYTVAGAFYGGATSNLVMKGATTLNAISNGLNNFTVSGNTALGGSVTVNGTLALTNGILNNGANLTMASGTTISRSGGSLVAVPTFAGTVNLIYTGGLPITTGKELPTGSSVLNNLTSNAGGVTQFANSSSTTNLLTDAFPNLTSWTGNKGTAAGQFNTVASINAGGTTPEVDFIGSASHSASSTTYYIYRGPINTTGYSAVNVSFKIMSTGNYTQNFATYLKLQSSTSASGPWHDVWSVPYSVLAAQTVSIPNYTTDVGGNMYFQFAFVGDYYASDFWYFDNLVVDGITNTQIASTATVNGTFNLTAGTYNIGSMNTLTVKGALILTNGILNNGTYLTLATGTTINRSGGSLSSAPNFGTSVNIVYSGAQAINTGYEIPTSYTILSNLTTNTGGVTYSGIPTGGSASTLYSQGFNGAPADWTTEIVTNLGALANPIITYVASGTSANPIVTPSEGANCAEFNSYTCDAGDQIRLKKTTSIATTGKTNITVVLDWYLDNTYTNADNVTVQWSTDGTNWNNSFVYYRYNATSGWVTVNSLLPAGAENQATLYIALLFTGAYGDNCHLDNLKVNVTTPGAPIASAATINGVFDLTSGTFAIGANNSLVLNDGKLGSNAIISSTTSDLTVGGSGANLTLPSITNGLHDLTINRTNGATLGSSVTLEGTLALSSGPLSIASNTLTLNGGITGSSALIGGTTSNLTIDGSGSNLTLPTITNGLNNLTLTRANGATLANDLSIGSGGLTITNGALTVDYAKALTVIGTTTLGSSQCLILKSNATGTASFIDNGTINGSGTAKIERYLTKYIDVPDWKFHFLSSPVGADQAIETEFCDPTHVPLTMTDFYKWDEPTNFWINYRGQDPATVNGSFGDGGNFVAGKGYLVAYPDDVTKNFIGVPFTGSVEMACTNNGGQFGGWNLLGNPFPSAIDWDGVTKGSGMDDALYYYDNSAPRYRYYVALSGGIGTAYNNGSRYIPAMQGFMVHAKTTGIKTITMSNSHRVHQNMNLYYKDAILTDNVLNISVEGNDSRDDARICFYDLATENFDGEYDAYKLFGYNTTIPELYSVTSDNTQVAINTLPLSQMYVTVPVGFLPGTAGTFTFNAEGIDRFPETTCILLEDLKAGTIQKLNDNPVYSFTSEPADATSRFLLHFQNVTSITNPDVAKDFTIHAENGIITVRQTQSLSGNINVTDMAGRIVAGTSILTGLPATINMQGPPGVYIVSIITSKGVSNAKIFVK
jgi:hypothetical protein